MTLHAHITWQSRDCDGLYSGQYTLQHEDSDQFRFMPQLLDAVCSTWFSAEEGPGQLTVIRTNDPSQPTDLIWYCDREEGWEKREATLCTRDDITEPSQRDHTAERAGY